MRYGSVMSLCAAVFFSGCVSVRAEGAGRTAELKAGTAIQVTLIDAIDSHQSKAGDRFGAEITAPVMYGRYAVVPAGSKIYGVVDEASSPVKKLAQPATVRIVFDRIETPDGRVIPVHAGIHKDVDAAKAINKLGGSVGEHLGERELQGGGAGGVLLPLRIAKAARKAEEFKNKEKDVVIPSGTPLTLALKDTTPVPLDAAAYAGVSDADWAKAGEEHRAQQVSRPAPEPPATLRGALREQIGTVREPIRERRRELLRGEAAEE